MTDWAEFERMVHEDAAASIAKDELTPLEFGQPIMWATHTLGRTSGFTPLHCVGFPIEGRPYTSCGQLIPPPALWMPLNQPMVETIEDTCQRCAAAQLRHLRERVA